VDDGHGVTEPDGQAVQPATTDQPSWLGYAVPMGGIPVRPEEQFLHDRDWEGQLAAARRGPMSWGIPAFFLGYGTFYVLGLIITAVLASGAVHLDSIPTEDRGALVLLALTPNLFLGLGPAVMSWWKGNGLRRDFGIVPTRRDLWIGVLCGLVAFGIGLLVNLILQLVVFKNSSPGNNAVQQLSGLSGGKSVWLAIAALFVVIGAPLTEETLVRGALWGALEHYKLHRYAILALTSLIFAFMHQEPTVTLALFCQGASIGFARMITGRIGASMIAHATNNLIPALILFFGS
jgi:membrane protease YdiL (CAAX protease family)